MSVLRQDPLTGRWVIIAAGRSKRPNEFPAFKRENMPGSADGATCPFCPGHEDRTPPEILALGRPPGSAANGQDWHLRTVANLFPALVPETPKTACRQDAAQPGDLYREVSGIGCHEVVVYSPDHQASPATLSADRFAELLGVLRDRSREFARHPAVRYVSPFCNHGPEAGATLAHPHMQIIGAPEVPLLAVNKIARCADYHRQHGRCLLCDLEVAERSSGARLIAHNERWTGFAPWASRFAWEMLFVPRQHGASLNQATDEDLSALAAILAPAIKGLFRVHGDPSLNIVMHSATVDAVGNNEGGESYHFHLEVLPRLSRPAGFEVGTGYTINAVVPEDAARRLRQEWEQA